MKKKLVAAALAISLASFTSGAVVGPQAFSLGGLDLGSVLKVGNSEAGSLHATVEYRT